VLHFRPLQLEKTPGDVVEARVLDKCVREHRALVGLLLGLREQLGGKSCLRHVLRSLAETVFQIGVGLLGYKKLRDLDVIIFAGVVQCRVSLFVLDVKVAILLDKQLADLQMAF